MNEKTSYRLDDQVGYLLRRVNQRHLSIFAASIPDVTATQFAAMARLVELGPLSQNQLGRVASMDAATIKGVVDRLVREGLVETVPDPEDRRRRTVMLSDKGCKLFEAMKAAALEVSETTLAPLSARERSQFIALLSRLT